MTNITKYKAVNLKTLSMTINMTVLLIISIFSLWFALNFLNWIITPIFLTFALITPILFIYSKTAHITILNDKIIKKSIFGKKSILFDEVESFGMFRMSTHGAWLIQENDVNRKDWNSHVIIFLSKNKNFKLYSMKGSTLKFHYNEELYYKIKEILNYE